MAEAGAFEGVPSSKVAAVRHIGLNRNLAGNEVPIGLFTPQRNKDPIDYSTETIEAELIQLLVHFDQDTTGYMSRRFMERVRFEGDYDHLARFGEWDETQEPVKEVLK